MLSDMFMNTNNDFMHNFSILYFVHVIFVNFIFFYFLFKYFFRGLGDGKRVRYSALGAII